MAGYPRRRESDIKAKIEGYTLVPNEQAHQRAHTSPHEVSTPVTNPTPLVNVPMAPIPTIPAAMPIVDETMYETTTAGNKAKEEVSQGTQEIKKGSGFSVKGGGS